MAIKQVTYEDYNKLSGMSELQLFEALDLFNKMDWQDGAFLYFDINDIDVLQIMYLSEDKFLLEIANDSEDMVFLQRYASRQEAADMVRHFYETRDSHTVSGFYTVPVNEKTLDQVMQGK